jgi:cell division septation protein DedD
MQKANKERLIGAIILVLLLVSIVPVILDGNFKEAPKRNDSLERLDQIKKERRIETIDLKNKDSQSNLKGSSFSSLYKK